jgi:hypothetical protein
MVGIRLISAIAVPITVDCAAALRIRGREAVSILASEIRPDEPNFDGRCRF